MAIANQANPVRACLVLQQQMEDILQAKAPRNIVQETGLVNALLDPRNTSGFEAVQVNAFPGKGRPTTGQNRPKFEIRYEKPICGDANETVGGLCESQDRYDPFAYVDFTLPAENQLAWGFSIVQSDFDRVCEGRADEIGHNMIKAARQIRYSLEKKLLERFYALAGNYPSSGVNSVTNAKTLKILNVGADGTGIANPFAFVEVRSDYRKTHVDEAPFIVGGDALARYFDARSMAGLGQSSLNADPSNFGGLLPRVSLFTDSTLNAAGGSGFHALTWLPGTAQLVLWNQNTGDNEFISHEYDFLKTTMLIDGILFDYTMNFNKCPEGGGAPRWDIELSIPGYDLFALTDQLDGCYGHNFLLHYQLDCGDNVCEDLIGVAPSEASDSE